MKHLLSPVEDCLETSWLAETHETARRATADRQEASRMVNVEGQVEGRGLVVIGAERGEHIYLPVTLHQADDQDCKLIGALFCAFLFQSSPIQATASAETCGGSKGSKPRSFLRTYRTDSPLLFYQNGLAHEKAEAFATSLLRRTR